jgi:hypothetical protein
MNPIHFVYGFASEETIAILPKPVATHLAAVLAATRNAKTFQELYDVLDAEEMARVQEHFEEHELPLPEATAPFDPELLPGYLDYEWPVPLEIHQARYIPHHILFAHATERGTSPMDVPYIIESENLVPLLNDLHALGHTSEYAERLIHEASWLDRQLDYDLIAEVADRYRHHLPPQAQVN